jgi:hypothetical protein
MSFCVVGRFLGLGIGRTVTDPHQICRINAARIGELRLPLSEVKEMFEPREPIAVNWTTLPLS